MCTPICQQMQKNPNRLVMVELWENEALWLKFLQSDVVAKLSELAGTHTSNWDTQKLHLLSGLERISLEQVQEAQALSDAMWNKLKK